MKKLFSCLELIRVKHWIKNVLVFVPLFFGSKILNFDIIYLVLLGFMNMSFASSIVYIINDINDIENDRKHPKKKYRPLPSGEVSIGEAKTILIVLVALVLFLSSVIYKEMNNILVFFIPCLYVILNLLYSVWLKNIPIIDVVILVSGFLLRVIYGGVVGDIEVSKWLCLMTIFASFFLGFGKRRNEIIKNGSKSRKVLSKYNKDFLDKNMYLSCTLALMCYGLWCTDSMTIERVGNDYMFWTLPIVMVIFFMYSLDIEGNSFGDPVDVILSNKSLIGVIIFYILVMFSIIYIF